MGRTRFSTGTALALAAVLLSSSTAIYAVAALPKHSVGKKQLKTSAVTNKKIAKNAVTGSKVKESTLGQVPRAGFATSAGNTARLENKGAADFVGAPRMAFGKANGASVPAAAVLSLPNVGVTVTTTGGTTEAAKTSVVVNLPSTAPASSWFVNVDDDLQMFSMMGGPLTLGAPTGRDGFSAHIWRFDTSAGIYLHCVFDKVGFTSSRPLSCSAFST